jgi:predicted adenine nucleotide alpha hydrolase (AANH) superfamily ATPase
MVKQFTKEECLKWFKNPNRNPRTDYKIKKESKHSIYKQLL